MLARILSVLIIYEQNLVSFTDGSTVLKKHLQIPALLIYLQTWADFVIVLNFLSLPRNECL